MPGDLGAANATVPPPPQTVQMIRRGVEAVYGTSLPELSALEPPPSVSRSIRTIKRVRTEKRDLAKGAGAGAKAKAKAGAEPGASTTPVTGNRGIVIYIEERPATPRVGTAPGGLGIANAGVSSHCT